MTNKTSPDDLLTRREAAIELDCTQQTVDVYRRNWSRNLKGPTLPWVILGMGRIRIRRADVDALLAVQNTVRSP
jgi:hypothetical protein